MEHTVQALLKARGITLCAPISLSDCRILRPYLLERAGIARGTAFLFTVPYYTTKCEDTARNISAYAVGGDYHAFCKALFDEILPVLQENFPKNRFAGFSDHSPIGETEAACRAGLGVLGRHGLLITEPYASYVFLGEIVTDAVLDVTAGEVTLCPGCGACAAACPVTLDLSVCRSALTQKKGALTEKEESLIRQGGCAWGCDRCQEACPFTKAARDAGTIYSPIPFFENTALPHLTVEAVTQMPNEDFAARAYSWRGRETVMRNLRLLQKGDST